MTENQETTRQNQKLLSRLISKSIALVAAKDSIAYQAIEGMEAAIEVPDTGMTVEQLDAILAQKLTDIGATEDSSLDYVGIELGAIGYAADPDGPLGEGSALPR